MTGAARKEALARAVELRRSLSQAVVARQNAERDLKRAKTALELAQQAEHLLLKQARRLNEQLKDRPVEVAANKTRPTPESWSMTAGATPSTGKVSRSRRTTTPAEARAPRAKHALDELACTVCGERLRPSRLGQLPAHESGEGWCAGGRRPNGRDGQRVDPLDLRSYYRY